MRIPTAAEVEATREAILREGPNATLGLAKFAMEDPTLRRYISVMAIQAPEAIRSILDQKPARLPATVALEAYIMGALIAGLNYGLRIGHEQGAARGELTSDFTRSIRLHPGWDRRERGGDLHGAELAFVYRGPAGAIVWTVFTNWMSDQSHETSDAMQMIREATVGTMLGVGEHAMCRPIALEVRAHSLSPQPGRSDASELCCYLDRATCYNFAVTTMMQGQGLWSLLVRRGEDPIWRELESRYKEAFGEPTQ